MDKSPRCERCGGKGAWSYVKDGRTLTFCSHCDRTHAAALDRQGWRIETRETVGA
jgi:hypothetical protein